MKKDNRNFSDADLEQIKRLLILQLYYVNDVPAELIAKAIGIKNANSIRNMFPKQKLKGKTRIS